LKRDQFVVVLVLVALMLALMYSSLSSTTDAPAASTAKIDIPDDLLDGDLIFRRGHDVIARLIISSGSREHRDLLTDAPRYSHVGVIVLGPEGPEVVHAMPRQDDGSEGVYMEPLIRFMDSKVSEEIGVYRVDAMHAEARTRARDYVIAQLGKPFDSEFRYSDDSSHYCSELVMKALAVGGVDLFSHVPSIEVLTLNEPVFTPDSIRRVNGMRRIWGARCLSC
jgi:uncharacterized protein YycO